MITYEECKEFLTTPHRKSEDSYPLNKSKGCVLHIHHATKYKFSFPRFHFKSYVLPPIHTKCRWFSTNFVPNLQHVFWIGGSSTNFMLKDDIYPLSMDFRSRKWMPSLKLKQKAHKYIKYQGYLYNRAAPLAPLPISWSGQYLCMGSWKRISTQMRSEVRSR